MGNVQNPSAVNALQLASTQTTLAGQLQATHGVQATSQPAQVGAHNLPQHSPSAPQPSELTWLSPPFSSLPPEVIKQMLEAYSKASK